MRSVARLAVVVAPATIGAAFVLSDFVANAVPLSALVRPLVLVVAAAIVITSGAVAALGGRRGPVWAFVVVAALCGMFLVAGAVVFALALFGILRSGPNREYVLTGALCAAVGVAVVLAPVVAGFRQGAFAWSPIPVPAIDLDGLRPGPSLHLLLLDGYPRADVLDGLGFDNRAFLDGLEERGFDVYPDSHSNYDRTPFSVASVLSMRHLPELEALWTHEPRPDGLAQEERLMARALLDLPAIAALESIGYRTRVISGPVVHVPIGSADEQEDAGTATNFELDLLQRTVLAAPMEAFGFAASQQRSQIETTLDRFAVPPPGPSFTFAHVMAPHAPFVFTADGSPAAAPPCYPASCSIFEGDSRELGWSDHEYWQRLFGQVAHLNDLVLDAVDRVIDADPRAVIVIFSDHGVRIEGDPGAMYRNLLVARTPGNRRLLGDAPTPINILPAILEAYLGADIPRQPDTRYAAGEDPWLKVESLSP